MGEGEKTAALLVIGNEILSGRTTDANIPYIATGLDRRGIRLVEVRIVRDHAATIAGHVNTCRAACDYVFTTGGIGPTHDDVTAAAVAAAMGVPLVRHPEAAARLTASFARDGLEANAARMRMADVPRGATLIDNPVSIAPGFQIGNVYVMAGVPAIMRAMFDSLDLPGGAPVLSRSVRVAMGEGSVAAELGKLQDRYPDIEFGSYPKFRAGRPEINLVARGTDRTLLEAATRDLVAMLRRLGGAPVPGPA